MTTPTSAQDYRSGIGITMSHHGCKPLRRGIPVSYVAAFPTEPSALAIRGPGPRCMVKESLVCGKKDNSERGQQ